MCERGSISASHARGSRAGRLGGRVGRSAILRPRLLAQLHAAVGNGLTVLQAPAGYGKTILLSQFSHEVDFRICWVTLDSGCVAPETLAERVVAALREPSDGIGFSTAARDGDLKAYMGVALREAIDTSEQPLLLIFDNVHELRCRRGRRSSFRAALPPHCGTWTGRSPLVNACSSPRTTSR
jgi:ATP/maltotriose-dependent transcriptional regulator MalT